MLNRRDKCLGGGIFLLKIFQQPLISLLKYSGNFNYYTINNENLIINEELNNEITYSDWNLLIKWFNTSYIKNVPINLWFINYYGNSFIKTEIMSNHISHFLKMKDDGSFSEILAFDKDFFSSNILPTIIIFLSTRIKNNLIKITYDYLIFHIDDFIQNAKDKNELIINLFNKKNNAGEKFYSDLDQMLLSFDLEIYNLFKMGKFNQIVEKKSKYLESMNTLRIVIESYISLRKYEECEDLIKYSLEKFPGTNNEGIRLFLRGKISNTKGLLKESISELDQAISTFESDQIYWINKANTVKGWSLIGQGEFSKAYEIFTSILPFFEINDDEYETNLIYSALSTLNEKFNDFDKAIFYGNKTLNIYKLWGNKLLICHVLNNLGVLNQKLGNINNALKQYNECLKYQIEINDLDGISRSKTNIAYINFLKGNLTQAKSIINEAVGIREKLGLIKDIATSLYINAMIYEIQGNLDEAKTIFEKALELFNQSGENRNKHYIVIYLAFIFHLNGDSKKAFNILIESIDKSVELKEYELLLNNLNILLKIFNFINEPFTNEFKNFIVIHNSNISLNTPLLRNKSSIIEARLSLLEHDYKKTEEILKEILSSKNLPLEVKIDTYDLMIENISEQLKIQLSTRIILNLEETVKKVSLLATEKELNILLCKSLILSGKIALINYKFDVAKEYFEKANFISSSNNYLIYSNLIDKENKKLIKLEESYKEISSSSSNFRLLQLNEIISLLKSFIVAF